MRHNRLHGAPRLLYQLGAFVDIADRLINQHLNFARCSRRSPCQGAHLGGHHCKATALLTRTRRLHRGIQSQNIGLKGNAINHTNNVGNFARGGVDGFHGVHHLPHDGATLKRHICRHHHQLAGLLAAFVVLFGTAVQLHHGCRCLLQRTSLLLGARGQIQIARCYLAGCGGNGVGATAHFCYKVHQAVVHVL